MAWTNPTTRATGDLISAAIWNADLVNNLSALRGARGSVGCTYAAGDQLTASVAHGLGTTPSFAIAVPTDNWQAFFIRSVSVTSTNVNIVVGPAGFSFSGGNVVNVSWYAQI